MPRSLFGVGWPNRLVLFEELGQRHADHLRLLDVKLFGQHGDRLELALRERKGCSFLWVFHGNHATSPFRRFQAPQAPRLHCSTNVANPTDFGQNLKNPKQGVAALAPFVLLLPLRTSVPQETHLG